jgi:hypothetical protein
VGALQARDLALYAKSDLAAIEAEIAQLEAASVTSPGAQILRPFALEARIAGLVARARDVRAEQERRERERQQLLDRMRQESTSELAAYRTKLMLEIADPVELDYALPDLAALPISEPANPAELERAKRVLHAQFVEIRRNAHLRAESWKSGAANRDGAVQTEMVAAQKAALAEIMSMAGDDGAVIRGDCEILAARVANGDITTDELSEKLTAIATAVEDRETQEESRRHVVASVMTLLAEAGFVVGDPVLFREDGDEVRIIARRPSGAEASFAVHLDGGFDYKFDNYEGQECSGDIANVLPRLQEIYGVELSDERVIWENPDRISRSARPFDDGAKERGNV